jgi:hypothetical protein
MVGRALGISKDRLLQQAGAAQLRDHEHFSMLGSQRESFKRDAYGDQPDDQEMIKIGFNVYDILG